MISFLVSNGICNLRRIIRLGFVASFLYSIVLANMATATEPAGAVEAAPIGAFVYTELQISVPFKQVPWQAINKKIRQQPGFINKTWLSGVGNHSAGGFYAFDTIAHAQQFVTGYFAGEAKSFGVAHTTRIFDAKATAAASRGAKSAFYKPAGAAPKAFVFATLQISVQPFNVVIPWAQRNQQLMAEQGLLSKTWLSGVNDHSVGGFYAFDSLENAKRFTLEVFPATATAFSSAVYTRIFDGENTVQASQEMQSPFYR